MDDDFSYFYHDKSFGPALDTRPVPEASLAKYQGHLPNQLLQYWREHGWSGYGNGLFWIIDPEEYVPVVDAWLEDTPFEGKDRYHAIAMTAFGKLFLWGEETGPSLSITTLWSMIFPRDKRQEVAKGGSDRMIRSFFVAKSKTRLDQADEDERPLFDRAVQKLGRLYSGQMYGLFPALALGGPCNLEHLQKTDAVTHLVMLAQLGEKQIMRDTIAEAKASGLYEQILNYKPNS